MQSCEFQEKLEELLSSFRKETELYVKVQGKDLEEVSQDLEKIHERCSIILGRFQISYTMPGVVNRTRTVLDQLELIYDQVLKLQGADPKHTKRIPPNSGEQGCSQGLVEARTVFTEARNREEAEDEIGSLTREEEDQRLSYELKILRESVELKEGSSFGGKSVSKISGAIPTDLSLVIIIENFLNVPLTRPESYHEEEDSEVIGEMIQVQPKTREILCIQQLDKGSACNCWNCNCCCCCEIYMAGQIGFTIPNTQLKLFANFQVESDRMPSIGLSLGLATTPVGEPACDFIWNGTKDDKFRPDTRASEPDSSRAQLIVSNQHLRAWGGINRSMKGIMRLAIWSEDVIQSLNTPAKPSLRHWRADYVELVRSIGTVREPFACRVIFENLLNTTKLIAGCESVKEGTSQDAVLESLRPSEKESILISGSSSVEGLLCYKIENTDVKLVAAFWIGLSGSRFCITFVSAETGVDRNLLDRLASIDTDWIGSHCKVASSWEGEQKIQIRKFEATALLTVARPAMTSRHSLLKVSIQPLKASQLFFL